MKNLNQNRIIDAYVFCVVLCRFIFTIYLDFRNSEAFVLEQLYYIASYLDLMLLWSCWVPVGIFSGLEWPKTFCSTQPTYTSNFCFLEDAITVIISTFLGRGVGGGKCVTKENPKTGMDLDLSRWIGDLWQKKPWICLENMIQKSWIETIRALLVKYSWTVVYSCAA